MTRSLGEASLIEAESETILIDQQIDYAEFSKDVVDCLPKDLPWTIPQASWCHDVARVHVVSVLWGRERWREG